MGDWHPLGGFIKIGLVVCSSLYDLPDDRTQERDKERGRIVKEEGGRGKREKER